MAAKPRDGDALITEGLARANDACNGGRAEKTELAASPEEIVSGQHFCGARNFGFHPLSAGRAGPGPSAAKRISGAP